MSVQITPGMTELQATVGYWWQDPGLLREALTHSSWGNRNSEPHSQRLEFLGDSVLDLVSAEWLMAQYPRSNEGFMSQCRAGLVQEAALVRISRAIGIDRALIVGNEYLRNVDSVLADGFEAMVGALYLDCGSILRVRQALLDCGFFV